MAARWCRMLTFVIAGWPLVLSMVFAAPPRDADAEFSATHVLSAETEYYRRAPQRGRRPEGQLGAGTRVRVLKAAGGYAQLQTDRGLVVFVPASALSRVLGPDFITPDVESVAVANNAFALSLYDQLRAEGGNQFFSPASISSALAMAHAGADGATRAEMAQVLHLDRNPAELPDERVHVALGKLTLLLNSGGAEGGYVLRSANRLWGQDGYEFLPEFLQASKKFGAELAEVDFRQPDRARQQINTWVAQQTREKIPELLPPGLLRPDMRLVITNAIYFLGGWEEEFSENGTQPQPFWTSAEESVEAPLMHRTSEFGYAEADGVQVLEMAYRGGEISMVVLLPRERDGLEQLEQQLSAENVAAWIREIRQREVEVALPKFQLRSSLALGETLQSLGMRTAFSPDADFSRMSSGERLMIADVVHQAYVDVNEKGTEAAAATAVLLAPTSAAEPEPPAVFRADHPFVFLIRDRRSGAILFLGRLERPTEAG